MKKRKKKMRVLLAGDLRVRRILSRKCLPEPRLTALFPQILRKPDA